MRRTLLAGVLVGGMLLCQGVVHAQTMGGAIGGGGGGLGGGGLGGGGLGGGGLGGGGLGGSFTGSGTGGFSGTGGSFTGNTGGSFTGTSTSRTGTSTQFGPFGRYLGNPLALGGSASTLEPFQTQSTTAKTITFGQPFTTATGTTGNTARVTRTAAGGGTLGGLGTSAVSATRFAGANTFGIRRIPSYVVEPVFDVPARTSISSGTIREDLQGVVSRSTRLPSRANIRVTTSGDVVTLRGEVRDDREKRLAEAIVRLSPGVREVRNLLEPVRSSGDAR